ncbi:IS66 family transposase [Glaciimonas sp. GG7]
MASIRLTPLFGGDISRNRLAASVVRLGIAFQPMINLLRYHLLDSEVVFRGDTIMQVPKEPVQAVQNNIYMCIQMNGWAWKQSTALATACRVVSGHS